MAKQKTTKRALLLSALSLLMCVSMFVGSTFAWFTDSVTSAGNKIQSGTLKLDVELLDKDGKWNSIKEDKTALFNYDKWEPGYTEFKVLKVENEGNLALKWYAKFVSEEEMSILADAIDVYVCPSETELAYPADRNLEGYTKVGTVAEFVNTIETTTKGELNAKESAYLGIALKMQEEAGNDYQDKTIGSFDIQILATQLTYEKDSFGDQYDASATYPAVGDTTVEAGRTESVPVKAGDVTVEIPANAEPGDYKLTVENTSVTEDEEGNYVANFDINLTKDGNKVEATTGVEYTVTIKVANGINPDTVKVLHKGVEVANPVANPADGTVTFKTDSFSPYSVIYTVDCDIFVETDAAGVKTHYVFTADGFEQLNQMMANKTAGQYARVKLCANIDMTGKTWKAVDSHADTAFYLSEFDGQGYTISNMTIEGQAMFTRFAGFGDVVIKDVTFNNVTVNTTGINASILTVQTYQNLLLDNVDIMNSSITGAYKVAPFIGSVYDENEAKSITATLKNCDVSNTIVTATQYDFFTCGMVSFVYTTNNDFVDYENCSVTGVQLKAPNVYSYHANIHYTSADTDDQINEHPGVKVTNVTFENI